MIKRIALLGALGLLGVTALAQVWVRYTRLPYDFSSCLYWLIFLNWLILIRMFRFKSQISLGIGLLVVVVFVGLEGLFTGNHFESYLRLGMVFWFTGISQALIEHINTSAHD